MIHISLIICFLAVFLHDSTAAALGLRPINPAAAAGLSLAGFAAIIMLTHTNVVRWGRIVDRTGAWAAVRAAETTVRRSRFAAVILHLVNIAFLSWVQAVRSVIGDVILIDELVIIVPVLVTWAAGWWSLEPIERRVREASLIRNLDGGAAVYPIVTRPQFVLSNIRYHVLLLLLPMSMLLAWAETVERYAPRVLGTSPGSGLEVLVQLAGVALLFVLMPIGLRVVWDTAPLGAGPLRESLSAMCRRCRVRVGDLLVWRTHGLMLCNGAVIGLFWPLRYILLTDALLDALPQDQVEAVTAHEVGHVRRRHLIWLAIAMLTSIAGVTIVLSLLQFSLAPVVPALRAPGWEALLAIVALASALGMTGFVSRRFEWQADAFAATALSTAVTADGRVHLARTVTPGAVASMQAALSTVAQASGLPLRAFSWRHGSIWTRQRKLAALVGRPVRRLAIDREVLWLKLTIAVAGLVVALAASGLLGLAALAQSRIAGP